MRIIGKRVDTRSIRRLGAQLWRDGHETLEFFIPQDLSRESLVKIGARLPFLKHRNRPIIVDFVADQDGLLGTLIVAHYKRS
ncbi:MAG: hypothetical protein HYT62_03440 [Candidatus Yanofskybacteria bacterium]|nr:hypothetical protein [Candidatus Yanofskybacteria bacterium]